MHKSEDLTHQEDMFVAEVDYGEAKKLADIASIHQDLIFTIQICKRLIKLLDNNSNDWLLQNALWSAALVSYNRCFAHGRKNFELNEREIFGNLPGEAVECHQYYRNLRDKNIAHSVNPFEQIAVGLVLSEPNKPKREILGVSTLSQRLICLNKEGVKQLGMLSEVVRKKVAALAKEFETKTLNYGKSLDIDSLYKKARVRTVTPNFKDAAYHRDNLKTS